jgi:hypothetical protein
MAPWGFLSPEDAVPWRAPGDLIRRMTDGFAAIDDPPAFVAANRLALEAFRSGERDLAAEICHLEIGYAAVKLQVNADEQTALLGLQPAINLVRLNGYVGDLGAARQGLADLEAIADGRGVCMTGLPLAAGQPARVRALARNNCLVETPKILWRRSQEADLLASSRRLLAKWPRSAVTGPLHTAEAPWLTGARDVMRASGLPAAPGLRRICALHVLAQSVSGPAGEPAHWGGVPARLAGDLFARRAEALAKPPGAAARDLACLGDSLAAMGRIADAVECLAQAHTAARPADPALANKIRQRWLAVAPTAAGVAGELSTDRLSSADLRAARDLAAARFGPSGSHG